MWKKYWSGELGHHGNAYYYRASSRLLRRCTVKAISFSIADRFVPGTIALYEESVHHVIVIIERGGSRGYSNQCGTMGGQA